MPTNNNKSIETIIFDSEDDYSLLKAFQITNIVLDTDEDIELDFDFSKLYYAIDEEDLVDKISDEIGWCIESLSANEVEDKDCECGGDCKNCYVCGDPYKCAYCGLCDCCYEKK